MFVPVKAKDGQQLMPMHPARARKLVQRGEATPYWDNGIYCARLNKEPSDRKTQDIAVGVDPGSKKEGFTVKSKAHTYLNVQADAHNKVGEKLAKRKELRRTRRSKNCPNRKDRQNRLANKVRIPAGTRARWDWKLRILHWLSKLFPVTDVCVEDIKARTWKGAKKWNQSFSPLQVGKQWFYEQIISNHWRLHILQGYETKRIRDALGLKKVRNKLSNVFEAHCVDSWCLAYHVVGGTDVSNREVFCIAPIPIIRRALHRQNPQKDGHRSRYGGTAWNGMVKNTLVRHVKYGLSRISGFGKKGISLSSRSGKRICRYAKTKDLKVLTRLNFNITT